MVETAARVLGFRQPDRRRAIPVACVSLAVSLTLHRRPDDEVPDGQDRDEGFSPAENDLNQAAHDLLDGG